MKDPIRFTLLFIAFAAFVGCNKKPSSQTQAVVTLGTAMQKSKADVDQLKKQAIASEMNHITENADKDAMHEKALALEKQRYARETSKLKAKIKRLESLLAIAAATTSAKVAAKAVTQADQRTSEECRQLDANLKKFAGELVTLEKENEHNEQMVGEIHKDAVALELKMDLDREVAAEKAGKIKTRR